MVLSGLVFLLGWWKLKHINKQIKCMFIGLYFNSIAYKLVQSI